jgi:purine-binding chemotaxis protein CheW
MNPLYVLFKVADAEYALPASDVLHMESFTGATRVPGAPAYVVGLMQIRRRVIPVVDLRVRFGLLAQEPSLDSRVVVVQSGERAVGLLADSAREVKNIAADDFRPPPELIAEQSSGYVTRVAQAGARMLMLIDLRRVIGEEVPNGK